MNLSVTAKFRLLHIVNHIIALYCIFLAFSAEHYYWVLIGFFCFLYTGIVGVNVGLHRYFSHQSFKTTEFKEKILLFSSILTSLGSPAMWCSVHRLHHTTSDQDKDPHNPKNGILKTWFAVWPKLHIPKRFLTPFLATKELRFVHYNYFLISFSIIIILAMIDIKLAGFLYCLPAIGCFHGAAAIGVLPHLQGRWQLGYRTYETRDLSHNNWLASILALGEGWHNNHHANPGRWWQGEKWWEFDPPALMIKYFFKK